MWAATKCFELSEITTLRAKLQTVVVLACGSRYWIGQHCAIHKLDFGAVEDLKVRSFGVEKAAEQRRRSFGMRATILKNKDCRLQY